jgi:hypothetical protein
MKYIFQSLITKLKLDSTLFRINEVLKGFEEMDQDD